MKRFSIGLYLICSLTVVEKTYANISVRRILDSAGVELYRDSIHYNDEGQRSQIQRWQGALLFKAWTYERDASKNQLKLSETRNNQIVNRSVCSFDTNGQSLGWEKTPIVDKPEFSGREYVSFSRPGIAISQRLWGLGENVTRLQFASSGLAQSLTYGPALGSPLITASFRYDYSGRIIDARYTAANAVDDSILYIGFKWQSNQIEEVFAEQRNQTQNRPQWRIRYDYDTAATQIKAIHIYGLSGSIAYRIENEYRESPKTGHQYHPASQSCSPYGWMELSGQNKMGGEPPPIQFIGLYSPERQLPVLLEAAGFPW